MAELITNATFNPDNVLLSDAMTGQIPTEQGGIITKNVIETSAIMRLARYEEMNKLSKTFMYLAEGPGAYWVGEGEKIETSKSQWLPIELVAKKIAVILPVSNEFLSFTVTDFFEQMKPHIAEAFQLKFDQAALFGTSSPYASGISVFERATAAGNVVTSTGAMYSDVNDTLALVEDGDNEPNAIATIRGMNHKFRGTLDGNNLPIFNDARQGVTASVLGLPISYASGKSWDRKKAEILTGDWNQAVYGIPQGIEYKILEEATLSTIVGEDGQPINLAERDLVALRATMYVAFQTIKEDAFAALVPAGE